MTFADRLDASIAERGNPCLVGLDPHLDLLPEPFAKARDSARPRAERAELVAQFCCELADVVAGRVPAVKPQSAFFELLGADGVAAWERVVDHSRARGLLVVGDVKRGDIGSTAAAYARAHLAPGPGACDAVTINPYLGAESVEPFLRACTEHGAGIFVLVRTSNPGSAEFQAAGDPPLVERVARAVAQWGEQIMGECGLSSVGAVVGATHPAELARLRALMPKTPLLLPGYGAQGASGADLVDAYLPGQRGALVAASRSVAFAWRSRPDQTWQDAASAALDEMIADVTAHA